MIYPIRAELKYGQKLNGRQSQACASFDWFVVALQMVLWGWELWFWVSKRTYGTETSRVNSCELFYWLPDQSSQGGTQRSLPHQSCWVAAAIKSFLLISRLDTNAFELFFPFPRLRRSVATGPISASMLGSWTILVPGVQQMPELTSLVKPWQALLPWLLPTSRGPCSKASSSFLRALYWLQGQCLYKWWGPGPSAGAQVASFVLSVMCLNTVTDWPDTCAATF